MNSFKERYGNTALVAGASEGLGAAFATQLASLGLDLVLIARRKEPLDIFAQKLRNDYAIQVQTIAIDLADADAVSTIAANIGATDINFLVYNACLSHIGHYLDMAPDQYTKLATVNMITPMKLLHHFGAKMTEKGRGGIVLMSSMAGLQGSAYLSVYGATKAFDKIIAEGLWYEWKTKGVDVIACCAGATATPNYINTKPLKTSFLEPAPQLPEEVVAECFQRIGAVPSFVSGRKNRLASFFMHKILPRKLAIKIMGDTAKKMYSISA